MSSEKRIIMEHKHDSSEKIEEALKLLEEAAEQKKDELKNVISGKYTHLKNLLVETEGSLAQSLTDATKRASEAAVHAKDAGVEKTLELSHDLDKSVHQNPWPYIGGTAVFSLLLGFFLGRNPK